MGNEKPPAAKEIKPLDAFETKEKDQRKQCFSLGGVSRFKPAKQPIFEAAQWLHEHRSEVGSAIIPALRERFHLSALEAIEAAKLARKIEQGRRA